MSTVREYFEDLALERKELGPVDAQEEKDYIYEEIPFDDWISEHDEATITLFHDLKDRASSYGLPLVDSCDVTDFLYFVYSNSSSKYKKVPVEYVSEH